MIVHVYNPERILNGHSNSTKASSSSVNDGNKSSGKSPMTKVPSLTSGHQQEQQVQEKQGINRPPPSPKMLRQSLFKGPHSRDSQQTSAAPEDEVPSCTPCVAFTDPSTSTTPTATANSHNNKNSKFKLRADSSASMDSSSPELDGIASWASARTRQPAPHLPSSSSQMAACTCNCSTSANNSAAASGVNVGQEQHLLSPSSLSSSPANSGHVRSLESRTDHRETSAASSHYFSPVSSFSNNSGAGVHNSHHHHDDSGSSNKDPDSLEYKYVKDSSSPLVTRKASLDRILSPQVTRRPAYSSSPSNSSNNQTSFFSPVVSSLSTHRDKSLSPVSPAVMSNGAVIPLANSMSNASIHSNYSEDSLMASSTGARGCHPSLYSASSVGGSSFAGHAPPPVNQRWNNVHPYDNSGHWIPETGSCMAVEKRPATSTAALAASTATASSSLDFSKDSLNSTASGLVAPVTGGGEILHRSSDEQGIGATANVTTNDDFCDDDEEDGSESCSIKLEPLAFTIDFGDVSPVKSNKKKETPKRLAERLAASSGQSSSQKRQQQASKAEAAKKSESGASEPVTGSDNNKMLKSLSSRLASHHQLTGGQKFASSSGAGSTSNGGHEVTESSPIGLDSSRRSSAPINKSGGSKTGSASSGSRHSSVGRNNNEHVKTNGLNKKKQSATAQQRQRSPSPPQPVQSPLKSRQANVYNNGSVKNTATAAAIVHSHKIGSESLLLLQRSIESDDGHWLSGGDDIKNRPPSPVMTNEYEDEECEERCDDNVSETGTYTIGKDSASPDEDQSRRDIDRIFGLIPQTPTAPTSSEGSAAVNGQGDSSSSLDNRSTPQWIREWAAQVAQQQEAPLAHLLVGQVGLSKPPSHPRPPPPDLPTSQRPRRRLPSVPSAVTSNGSSRSRSSPRPSDMSDPSDSSLETESFLRDTESVVSAMQARMDGRSSTESDAETRSSSSYRTSVHQSVLPVDLENSRKLSAQLRAKIRSLDEPYPIASSSSGTNSAAGRNGSSLLNRETSYVISSSASGGVSGVTGGMTSTVSSSANMIHNELHGSGGDDSKSLHSDSSLSDITSGEMALRSRQGHDDHKSISSNVPPVRYNRALSLRRGRLGLDVEQSNSSPNSASSRTTNKSPSRGSSPHLSQPLNRKLSTASVQSQSSTVSRNGPPSASSNNASSASFSRNDGGRFSLRVGSKTSSSTPSSSTRTSRPKVSKSQSGQLQPQGVTGTPPQAPSSGPRKSRSNSTLSSKEAEFQNWKRRKNYDPMKAAAEGKKKEAARRAATGTLTMSQSMIGTVTSSMASSASSQSPSPPPRTIIRSASFTCVNNVQSRSSMDSGDSGHLKYNNNSRRTSHHKQVPLHSSGLLYSSEDENEMLYSPPKKASPKPSPMTTRKYMGLNPSLVTDMSDMMSVTSADVDLISSPGSPRRKAYMDETNGMLMRSSTSNSSLRARTKIEALDNLVISTIHGLSFKIRNNAETLMKKLRPQYIDDLERLSLIDDSLNRLADCVTESPIHSVAAGRSTSRELSGTLKVMKRVEQVFQALDAVLFEEVMEGAGEEGAILNDGTTTEGEDWNGYTSGDFY